MTFTPRVRKQFDMEISRWVKVSKDRFTLLHRNLLVVALQTLREMTPVDTGRAKDSWRVRKTAPDQRADRRRRGSKTSKVVGKIVTTIQFAKARRARTGGVYFISNNVGYAKRLEDGHSRQSELMLQRTFHKLIAEFPAMVDEAKRGVRR